MRELDVPAIVQSTSYTCGPASLASVLRYLGRRSTETGLVRDCRCTEKDGTSPEGLVRAARRRGVVADVRLHMTVDEVAAVVRVGRPVIVLLQAWADGGPPHGGYRDDLDDGHYVVATAVGRSRVIFQDPSLPSYRAVLTRDELRERWQDHDSGRLLRGLGIVFEAPAEPRWREVGRVRRMG